MNNEKNKKVKKEIKLKSETYNNHDVELIKRREDESDYIMWGFVFGFILFFIILVCLIIFTK